MEKHGETDRDFRPSSPRNNNTKTLAMDPPLNIQALQAAKKRVGILTFLIVFLIFICGLTILYRVALFDCKHPGCTTEKSTIGQVLDSLNIDTSNGTISVGFHGMTTTENIEHRGGKSAKSAKGSKGHNGKGVEGDLNVPSLNITTNIPGSKSANNSDNAAAGHYFPQHKKNCALHQAPLDEIGIFLFHFLYVFVIYSLVLIEHSDWTQEDTKSPSIFSKYSKYCSICSCCCKKKIVHVPELSPGVSPIGIEIKQSTRTAQQMKQFTSNYKDMLANVSPATEFAEVDLGITGSILQDVFGAFESVSHDSDNESHDTIVTEINMTEGVDGSPDTSTHTSVRSVSGNITQLDDCEDPNIKEQQLTEKQLAESLDHITTTGDIMGRRGTKKLQKNKHVPQHGRVTTILEEAALDKELQLPDQSLMHGAVSQSITYLTRQPTPDLDGGHCSTVVFEFMDCFIPGGQVEKLKNKRHEWMKMQSKFQKEMLLGGPDRVNMLRKWLKMCSSRNKNLRFCIVSDEESKMIILLLQSLDLLRYFVSKNPNYNPKRKKNKQAASKLLSHVVGYDHSIQNNLQGKRYLILLKLIQFLQRGHQELLYVSNDQEVLDHVAKVGICKTQHVKTKGFLESDLEATYHDCME